MIARSRAAAVAHDVNRPVIAHPGVVGRVEMKAHRVQIDAARAQQLVDALGEIGVGDVDADQFRFGQDGASISTKMPGTSSKAPGQLSSLCGHDSQVASCGSHSAGMR